MRRAQAPWHATHFCMKNENTVLNNLIETLKDGQEGFRQAAEGVNDAKLKSLFGEYSQQRSRFATALQAEARKLGEEKPETSSSATGALHRGWMTGLEACATQLKADRNLLLDCTLGM